MKDANKLFDQNIIPEQVHKVLPKTTAVWLSFYFVDSNAFPRFYRKNPSEHLANKQVKSSMLLQQIQELFMDSLLHVQYPVK
jgi:hypothetical protein